MEERRERVENQVIELNLAVSALITTSNRYQDNFLVLVNEIRDMKAEIRDTKAEIRDLRADFLEVQSEVRGLQTQTNRILEEMERRRDEDNS